MMFMTVLAERLELLIYMLDIPWYDRWRSAVGCDT